MTDYCGVFHGILVDLVGGSGLKIANTGIFLSKLQGFDHVILCIFL
jgi:hypothetical protein